MAVPEDVMVQLIAELRSYSEHMRSMRSRAQAIMEKVNSNSLGSEPKPSGEESSLAEIQAAYAHLVVDFLAFMNNGSPGTADRITSLWRLNRKQSI